MLSIKGDQLLGEKAKFVVHVLGSNCSFIEVQLSIDCFGSEVRSNLLAIKEDRGELFVPAVKSGHRGLFTITGSEHFLENLKMQAELA